MGSVLSCNIIEELCEVIIILLLLYIYTLKLMTLTADLFIKANVTTFTSITECEQLITQPYLLTETLLL